MHPKPTPALYLRSLLFAVGQAITTVVFTFIALLALVLPYRHRYKLVSQWSLIQLWWLEKTCGVRHEVRGAENIPAEPTVVLSKHQSAWETLALQIYFSPQAWVLKRSLLMVPFFGWGLATLRPIAIDRKAGKDAITQVIEQGTARLRDRIWVVVFPEGTRVPSGKRGRYRMGGALLAERSGGPIVPVAHNAGDFWPRNSFLKYPGTIELVIGEPMDTHGRTAGEINALAEAWIEDTVARLREPYAGWQPATPVS